MTDEQAAAPVRFYIDDDARLPKTVKSGLLQLLRVTGEQVAGGYPQDWGAYRQQVGYIKGLEAAIGLCEEADEEFRGK